MWTISVFFYSTTLLLGYIYASLLTSMPSRQALLLHASLLSCTGLMLLSRWIGADSPLLIDTVSGGWPALSVLLTLLYALGLPVLLLASTSVLVQHLFARLTKDEPYALYGLSNAGSLLGLLLYPFVLEPFTDLSVQAIWWMCGYLLFLLILLFAWHKTETQAPEGKPAKFLMTKLRHRPQIIFMAAIPTFLLASGTEFLSKGIASFPLLWVIPLVLYLLSFIFAFRNTEGKVSRTKLGFGLILLLLLVFSILPVIDSGVAVYWVGFVCFSVTFYFICLYFHKRIYDLRPRVSELGSFYVFLTIGGALGSGLVGFVMPTLLNDQVELHYVLAALMLYFVSRYMEWLTGTVQAFFVRATQAFLFFATFLFLTSVTMDESLYASERNFYGTLKVHDQTIMLDEEAVTLRTISNGATNHGHQPQDARYERIPGSYYGPGSGIDVAIQHAESKQGAPRVAVVGLGAGMMGAYCDQMADLTFVEINPLVVAMARDHFTFLDMCPDKTEVLIGDGRLVLEELAAREEQKFDVIMIDAFTDDAIPSHLLTAEAFTGAYQPLLADGGVLVVHISNKYLNLHLPIAAMARAGRYEILTVNNRVDGSDPLAMNSSWVLVVKPDEVGEFLGYENVAEYTGKELLWTDQKNSVIGALSLSGSRISVDTSSE